MPGSAGAGARSHPQLSLGFAQVLAPVPRPVPSDGDTWGDADSTAKDHASSLEPAEKPLELAAPKTPHSSLSWARVKPAQDQGAHKLLLDTFLLAFLRSDPEASGRGNPAPSLCYLSWSLYPWLNFVGNALSPRASASEGAAPPRTDGQTHACCCNAAQQKSTSNSRKAIQLLSEGEIRLLLH